MQVAVQQAAFRRYAGHTTVVTIGGGQLRLTAGQGADGALLEVTIGGRCGGPRQDDTGCARCAPGTRVFP
jgi:hypothetical protein